MENNSYNQYPPRFIHTILKQYKTGVRGSGFKALASRYNIKGGHKLISAWYANWDGTIYSRTKQSGGDRRSILTPEEEKKICVYDFIVKKSKSEAATYQEVQKTWKRKQERLLNLELSEIMAKLLKLHPKSAREFSKVKV